MTKDLLQGTQARRLVRQAEGWTLEVECLVRRYGAVYRPSVRRIQGIDVILHHLHAVRAERLAVHARKLMDEVKPEGAEEHSFEPVDDEWIPSSLLKTNPPAFGTGEDPKLAQKLAALDRENRNLRARLAQIESMISSDVEEAEASHHGSQSPMPRQLSDAPPANEQASDSSPLAFQGTMVLSNGRPDVSRPEGGRADVVRPDLRRPIPLEPLDEAAAQAFDEDPERFNAAPDAAPSYDPTEGAEDDEAFADGNGDPDPDAPMTAPLDAPFDESEAT